MKNEETVYGNEETILDKTQLDSDVKQESDKESAGEANDSSKGAKWKKAAVGFGAGVLLGSVSSFAINSHAADTDADGNEGENAADSSASYNPEWADGSVAIAHTASDDMTFSEAFAAARAEVGPGGAFEWHGNVYSTYTAEEWDNMSAEERIEYDNHFNWSNHNAASGQQDDELIENQSPEQHSDNHSEGHSDNQPEENIGEQTEDESEIQPEEANVSVNNVGGDDNAADAIETEEVGMLSDDIAQDIEILGVVHDEETGANIGGVIADDQEVFLIDVDGDGTFDYMAADMDNSGQIDENEYADISAENITVDQFDNSSDASDMYASCEGETDYLNEDFIA